MLGSIVKYRGQLGVVTGVTNDGRVILGEDLIFWVDLGQRKQYHKGNYHLKVFSGGGIVEAPSCTDVEVIAAYEASEDEYFHWDLGGERVETCYLKINHYDHQLGSRWVQWTREWKERHQITGFAIGASYLKEEAPNLDYSAYWG